MKTGDYKIIVALYLRGDDLDPDSLTTKFGVNPTRQQRKGDKNVTSTNREYVAKTGMWGLVADSDSDVISEHITQLMSILSVDRDVIGRLDGIQDAYIDIFVAVTSDEDGESTYAFELSKENLTALERIGLPVHLTVTSSKE